VDALQPGDPERVGTYVLLQRLGTGGMGRVYLGKSPDGRMVAVKLIRPELAGNSNFRRRFAHEVQAAQRVSGIFTAPVVDADPDGPQPWLVTAYVAGPSLADAVTDHGALPVEAVRMLAAGLAEGLRAVHGAGLVHRDLKPSNVLLASDGPRIIDFGISRAPHSPWLTGGRVIGSPGFMSPEQAEGRDVGPATDIFSLGGVLLFASSGRPPFGSGSTSTLLHRVVYGTAALGHVPAEIRPLIERCLAKDPAARPTTDELLAELGRAQLAKGWLSRHLHHPPGVAASAAGGGAQPSPAAAGLASAGLASAGLTSAGLTSAGLTSAGLTSKSRSDAGLTSKSRSDAGRSDAGRSDAGRSDAGRPPADSTRPTGLAWAWRRRTTVIGWAAAATVAAAAGAAFGIGALSHHPSGHQVAATLPVPHTDVRKHLTAVTPPAPRTVVRAFIAAINARDWPKVWRIGGDHMSHSYDSMVAGYADTVRDVAGYTRVSGDHVIVWLHAHETGGQTQVFKVEYTVRDGIITAGRVLATYSWPDGAVSQTSDPSTSPTRPGPCPGRAWNDRLSRPGLYGLPSKAPATDA
jgi:serine/threonine protein kinase